MTHRSAPTIIKPVFERLHAAIVGLTMVPCIAVSSALPPEHWHHAGAHHAHAAIHQHPESFDHDGAEWSPTVAGGGWMDRVAVQGTGFRFFAPVSLPAARTVSPANPIRWIAVETIDAVPTHGPPGPVLSLRGPPALPSFVI